MAAGDVDSQLLEKFVFALCGLGLNITFAIYLAYVNIYGEAFSRTILGWMNLSIYTAATAVVASQIQFDAIFDKAFTCKATYTVRICFALLIVFLTLLSIPFASHDVRHVYLVGIMIGLFEGSGLSTSQQLASVVNPDFTKHVNTGFTVAQVLPIMLSAMLGFYDTQAGSVAAVAFAWIPAGLCLAAAVIFLVVVLNGNFDKAFAKMDANLREALSDTLPEESGNVGENAPLMEKTPSKDSKGESIWLQGPIMLCASVQFATNFLSMFLMPFLTYFGGHDVAHILVLVRFGSELAGRIVSHYWGYDYWNCTACKAVSLLVAATVLRAVMLTVVMMDAFGYHDLGTIGLYALVGLFFFTFGWSQSEVMTAIVRIGPPGADATLTRGMMFLCFGAQLLSLFVAIFLVEFHLEPEAVVRFFTLNFFG